MGVLSAGRKTTSGIFPRMLSEVTPHCKLHRKSAARAGNAPATSQAFTSHFYLPGIQIPILNCWIRCPRRGQVPPPGLYCTCASQQLLLVAQAELESSAQLCWALCVTPEVMLLYKHHCALQCQPLRKKKRHSCKETVLRVIFKRES